MGMEEKGKITLRVSLSLFYISSSVTWIPYVFFFFGLHPHFGEIHPSVISRKRIHGEKNFFCFEKYVYSTRVFVDSLAGYEILE